MVTADSEHSDGTALESCFSQDMTLDSRLMRKRRKTTRYLFGLTGILYPAGEKVGANVMVRDISPQGCELEHAEGPSIGGNCELYFDWRGTHVGLEAAVVWKDAEGRAGLKFLRVDKDTQKRLNELCAALGTQPPLAPQQKEADAARPVPNPTQGPRAARPTTPPEATPSLPLKPASELRRRLVPRYHSGLRGHLSNPATGATTSVTLDILSVSGARLAGSALPDAGQTCELQTEWGGKQLVLRGSVVWKTKERAGVKFSSVDEETRNLLRRTCANLRLQPPGPLPP